MNTSYALHSLLALSSQLRQRGFSVSPDQTMGFIEAVGILGPKSIQDVRRAALALFAIPPERIAEFDAIFLSIFYGLSVAAQAQSSDDEVDAFEATGGQQNIDVQESDESQGKDATDAERLTSREIKRLSDIHTLIDFERSARDRLPQRKSYRWTQGRGNKLDLRRTLRHAVKHDAEVIDLAFRRRKQRQRRMLLLLDISGSMKDRSSATLEFAHSLVRVAEQGEVFTLGTRLTRITPALRIDDKTTALKQVAELVADFDGGTRIGDALNAYLAVPRYSGFARGAAVVVISDGLERGDASAMINSIQRLSRIAWRISWLTPLAADPAYQPETGALKQVLPFLHQLGEGHSIESMCQHVLNLPRTA